MKGVSRAAAVLRAAARYCARSPVMTQCQAHSLTANAVGGAWRPQALRQSLCAAARPRRAAGKTRHKLYGFQAEGKRRLCTSAPVSCGLSVTVLAAERARVLPALRAGPHDGGFMNRSAQT